MNNEAYDFDYLIIGQGLAGTSMAMHLIELGKKVRIVHDPSLPSSSRVAAGIFNPLTGKKLVKTWLADELFPYAQTFYSSMEQKLGIKCVHSTPIYRPFRSIGEQNTYLAQTADPAISPYIAENASDPVLSSYIHNDHGGLEVVKSGWVDLPLLLDASEAYFCQNGMAIRDVFRVEDLVITNDCVTWKGSRFRMAIFCEGYQATVNPLFSWLPFAPVKGQLLHIETADIVKPYIINQGIFILPVNERECRVGATYSWDNLNWEVTDEARVELETKLGQLFKGEYTLTNQFAGIRPSSNDRRPIIGIHPAYPNVGIFNGLGTKGVTLGPYFAKQFADHLENGKELNLLVNIKRYFSLYFR
jgi:glycine/D-amino acid oxidase-like deaminating enzyme